MVFRRGASLSITWNELLQPKVHRSNRSAFRLSLNCIPTYALKHPAAKISPTPTASLYISSASCIGQKGNVGAAALERPPISSRLHHVLRRYAFDLDHHAFKLHRGRVHTFTRNDRIFVPCVRTQDDARTWVHVSMHGAWHYWQISLCVVSCITLQKTLYSNWTPSCSHNDLALKIWMPSQGDFH